MHFLAIVLLSAIFICLSRTIYKKLTCISIKLTQNNQSHGSTMSQAMSVAMVGGMTISMLLGISLPFIWATVI